MLLFILFCAGLAALTLFPPGFWGYLLFGCLLNGYPLPELYIQQGSFHWHITVFQDLFGGPWTIYMLLGNIVMFAPLGFFPALLWDKPRWWKSTLIAAGTSACVETVQLFIDRSSDINDLILNTLGGLAGYGFFWILHRFLPQFAEKFKCVKVDSLHG